MLTAKIKDKNFAKPVVLRFDDFGNLFATVRKKKLRGERYLENFYKKNISEIWNDVENGDIKLTGEEVDWGKPVGNEAW
jgi:S-adenosylmethionine hydrolase